MKVLIDMSFAARGASGTAVYVEQLTSALRERGEVEVVTGAQPRRFARGRGGGAPGLVRSAVNAVLDALWLHGGLPRAARRTRADVVHHPLPAHSRRIAAAQVCTVQDVAFLSHPHGYGRAWRLLARGRYRLAARRCHALVCPTDATAADVRDLLGADPDAVLIAPYGPGQAEGVAAADRDAAEGPLLYVGDAEKRKNLPGLLAAYSAYREQTPGDPAPLVLSGAAATEARGAGVSGARPASSADMLALVRGARALVHPALHEGFGFTPLEAMALGVAVLAVRNAATEEVCGDAALLVEPGALASGIVRIAGDAGLRQELARRGSARAREFSWEKSARAHESAYTLARVRSSARDSPA